MRLRVVHRRPGGTDPTTVQITADGTVTVGDLAAALGRGPEGDGRLPGNGAMTLRVLSWGAQQSRLLPARQSLLASGLRSGSTVELAYDEPATTASKETAAVLHVVGGPDEGIEVALAAGTSTIGRSQNCDVRLSDPMVSKQHATITVGEQIEIIDNNSANGVTVGGLRIARVPLAPGDVATLGGTRLSVRLIRTASGLPSTSTDIPFIRPARALARPEARTFPLPKPPEGRQRMAFPWLAMLAPLVMGVVLFLFLRNPMSIIFVALSPVLMVGTWLTQASQQRRQHREAVAEFSRALEETAQQLAVAQEAERAQLRALHPSVSETIGAITGRLEVLWCRRPEHPEFLQVRLGLGAIPPISIPEGVVPGTGAREFLDQNRRLVDSFSMLQEAPIVADLRSAGGLGLCGAPRALDGVARAVVTQIAGLHSPAEVVICCLTSAAGRGRWGWLEWLPHTWSPHSPLGVNHLSADPGTGKALLDALEELVAERSAGSGSRDVADRGPIEGADQKIAAVLPSVILVADQPLVDQARLTRLAELGPDAGVHVIWLGPTRAALPAACRSWLDVGDGTLNAVGDGRRGSIVTPVHCESVSLETADTLARQLAPVVDAGVPVDDESDLPRSVPVVSLIGTQAADDPTTVVSRWQENRSLVARDGRAPEPLEGPSSLRAPVGHTGTEVFTLDLRTQGPHALVGGTTGSGKSEFLQAWVLGMAHTYSPDRVSFLFVDYKGGSAFNRCVDLPHCVGLVTDLSPYLVRRALRSLRAEIHHRERLLNDKGAKDIVELEGRGDPDCPPSLIIVIDEFAALAGEIPEFVDGVVDVAQRGRSLGLHLVMATQRPAGVIKENLRANTNLRVALRMADEQDSTDVLGTPMAGHFPPTSPGRGAAKIGPGRIIQFQSGFPGSRTPERPTAPPIDIETLSFGLPTPWRRPERTSVADDVAKDIDRVVGTLITAARAAGVPAPRRPWLPELATSYNLTKLSQRRDTELILGVIDDPDRQSQYTEYFRPDDDGNILFVGTSGSGKSTALRTLGTAAGITPRSGPVQVYGLDFAGGSLATLEALAHVGSIIPGDDEERVMRTLRLLSAIAEERAPRYNAVNASTITEYRQYSGTPDEPRILLLVDGFGTFRTEYEGIPHRASTFAAFQRLLVDGRAVGVHIALTADRPSGIPASVASAFRRRVVLRQADEESYLFLGVPRDVLGPTSPPGRSMQADKSQELQLAVLGDSANVAVQARWLDRLAPEIARHHATAPEPIRALSAEIDPSGLPVSVEGRPVLGVADATLQPCGFDPGSVVLVAGPAQSGRSSAVRWLAHAVRAWRPDVQLVHLAPRRTPLSDARTWSLSGTGPDEAARIADRLLPLVQSTAGGLQYGVIIESLPDFLNTTADAKLVALIGACRRTGQLVVAEGETAAWSGGWPLLNEVRNARTGLLLQPDQTDGDTLLRTTLPRLRRADFPPGRGFWVKAGRALKVQVPWLG